MSNTDNTEERKAQEKYPIVSEEEFTKDGMWLFDTYTDYVGRAKQLQSAFLAGYSSKQSELEERVKELEGVLRELVELKGYKRTIRKPFRRRRQ